MHWKKMNVQDDWVTAKWPAPPHIKAGTTTRYQAGISKPPYDRFNLGNHVGDTPEDVTDNRRQLREALALPAEPVWLNQVHGNRIIEAQLAKDRTADGSYTNQANVVCALLTADCVPVLLCNKSGTEIAAIHVGWRGFCLDIIRHAVGRFSCKPEQLLAWIGPHISATNYEVGEEVRTACLEVLPEAVSAFTPTRPGHFYADLDNLVSNALKGNGVSAIYGCGLCTWAEPGSFFSYRREQQTGRMTSLIWMEQ